MWKVLDKYCEMVKLSVFDYKFCKMLHNALFSELVFEVAFLPLNKLKGRGSFWLCSLTILALIAMVHVIIEEMFPGRLSLNSVLLLVFMNYMGWSRLELMYLLVIMNIRPSFIYSHGYQFLYWYIAYRNHFFCVS